MTRATIVLFDIDGTLLDAKGAGRRAMEAGFAAVTGRADGLAAVRFAGMTDPQIVRDGLRAVGLPHDPTVVAQVIAAYLERLPAELRVGPPRRLPGVEAVLERLRGRDGVALGVGTGNVEAGARAKLRAAGLDAYFGFGGYGSDHESRAELLAVGARRGAASLGRASHGCRVLVVGDTPRDIAAAHAIGAECLAVATAFHGVDELRAAGPSAVVETLATPAAQRWLDEHIA
ncbi:MAG: HAD hydrolase-like protein [Myxococcales bacterium]|nr:HAD hydrolase-like protein [Myxococcales bacterium]